MVKWDINMGELDLEKNDKISVTKSHREILDLIKELKEIEKEFDFKKYEHEFIEVKEEMVKFLEVEPDNIEELEPVTSEKEIESEEFVESKKERRKFKIKYRTQEGIKKLKDEREATTFRIRFDNEGDLVNIDLNKIKKKLEHKEEKVKRKEKKVKIKESGEKKTKSSRFWKGLSVLKKSIPQKEELIEEEYDEDEEEEDQEEDY